MNNLLHRMDENWLTKNMLLVMYMCYFFTSWVETDM
jgi:hypothetical protein